VSEPPAPSLLVGVARTDITPPVGLDLSGFAARTGPALGARDPLTLSALVATQDATTVAMLGFDLIGLSPAWIARARLAVHGATGVPGAHQMYVCSHTHCGPATGVLPSMGRADPPYLERLIEHAASAVRSAQGVLTATELWLAEGASYAGANRRSAAVNPDGPRDGAVDEIDPTVAVAQFRAPGRHVIATLVNYGCHPTSSRECVWSADYPGHVRAAVEADTGAPCLYLNGAGGDVNLRFPDPRQRGFATARVLGHGLGRTALNALRRGHASNSGRVRATTAPATLRYAGSSADGVAVEVQALRIGDLAIVALPVEVFAADGRSLRSIARAPHCMLAGWSNGLWGYVPTRRAAASGGYEVVDAHRWYGHPVAWDPASGDRLRVAALAAIDRAFGPAAT